MCLSALFMTNIVVGKKSNVELHFTALHWKFHCRFPSDSLWLAMVSEFKVGLQQQQLSWYPPPALYLDQSWG